MNKNQNIRNAITGESPITEVKLNISKKVEEDVKKLEKYNLLELHQLIRKLSNDEAEYENMNSTVNSINTIRENVKDSIDSLDAVLSNSERKNLQFQINETLEDSSFKEFSKDYVIETEYISTFIPLIQKYINENFTIEQKSSMKYLNQCRIEILDKKIKKYKEMYESASNLIQEKAVELTETDKNRLEKQMKDSNDIIGRIEEMKAIISNPFDLTLFDQISQNHWIIKNIEKEYVNRKNESARKVSKLFDIIPNIVVAKASSKMYKMVGKPYIYAVDLFLLHIQKQIEKSERKENVNGYRIKEFFTAMGNIEMNFCDYPQDEIKEFLDKLDEILCRYKISNLKRVQRQKKNINKK